MEMPQPNESHARLECLIGTWVGEEHMAPSQWVPEPTTAIGRSVCRAALSGFAVICDYEQTVDGQTTYTGHGVYGYDSAEDVYLLHWFDSMGTGVDLFKGSFDGDVLTMVTHGPMGHMRMTSDHTTPGKLLSKMESSQDGSSWTILFTGEYAKK